MKPELIWPLLPLHLAALAAFWWLPGWAARRDAALFAANPTSDDNHRVFHRQRLLERLGIAVGLALLASTPLLWGEGWGTGLLSTAALLCAGGGLWFYRFTPLLNEARALAYVPRYYVSPDPRAAFFPDRLLWQRAVRAYPTRLAWNEAELHQERQRYAAAELRTLLRVALVAGLACEVVGLVWILL